MHEYIFFQSWRGRLVTTEANSMQPSDYDYYGTSMTTTGLLSSLVAWKRRTNTKSSRYKLLYTIIPTILEFYSTVMTEKITHNAKCINNLNTEQLQLSVVFRCMLFCCRFFATKHTLTDCLFLSTGNI